MRANTHVTLVVDNTAPQTQRSKCATPPQPFLTDQHPIYGGIPAPSVSPAKKRHPSTLRHPSTHCHVSEGWYLKQIPAYARMTAPLCHPSAGTSSQRRLGPGSQADSRLRENDAIPPHTSPPTYQYSPLQITKFGFLIPR